MASNTEFINKYREDLVKSNRNDYLSIYDRLEILASAFFSKNSLKNDEKSLESFYDYIDITIKTNRGIFGVQNDDFELITKPFASIIYLKFKDEVT